MKQFLQSTVVTAGLAIFSMLFGAANLYIPVQVGAASGNHYMWGITGFLTTAVLLPVIGLIAIILFNGNYDDFFARLGKIPGKFIIAFCMAVIGPMIAMSRIVTLSYTMLSPFLYGMSLPLFSILFCGLTFLATYQENKIIDLLGKFISPALLASLGIIIVKGLWSATVTPSITCTSGCWNLFYEQAKTGYETLDVLGSIFFASIVLSILKKNVKNNDDYNIKTLAWTGMKAGFIGCTLLGIVYTGMALLGVFYNQGITATNGATLFSAISFKILGSYGALIIATAVGMACFSTIVALATILAEYVQQEITHNKLSYIHSLLAVLATTTVISCNGLDSILHFSRPIIFTFYPVVIVITLVNIIDKLYDTHYLRPSALIALILSVYINLI